MTTNDDLLDDDAPEPEPDKKTVRQRLAEETRARAEAEARLAQIEKRELFRDAGLDPSNKQHAAFARAYDGALTVDAVKDYVLELGIKEQPAAPPAEPAPEEGGTTITVDRAANERIQQATVGDGAPPPDPDRARQILVEMAEANMHRNDKALDRLSEEYQRATGGLVRRDIIIE